MVQLALFDSPKDQALCPNLVFFKYLSSSKAA